MNLKTKEEIYCKNGGSYIRSVETEGHLKAMQEYADQQLESYKANLKVAITPHDDWLSKKYVIELIDTTTP